VCTEYNGSYPGDLIFFIDLWSHPESFEHRPICLIGLGGRFGGLRPVEHLQQVFGYRNSYVFPQRVFLFNIWDTLKNGQMNDKEALGLLKLQAQNFQRFVRGLSSEKLDANSFRAIKNT
ncbi:MAG: NAD(P)H-dependent oxidoreductase, partial [Bdellovibrionales bacterium]